MKLLVVGLLAAASGSAYADPLVGPYVSVGGGADFPRDVSSGTSAGSVSYDTGYLGNIAGGYSFGNGFRSDIEIGYSSANLSSSALGPVGGRVTKLTGTLNGFYDFDRLNWVVVPYVGIGGGATHLRGGSLSSGNGFEITGNRPSVVGIVGVSYPITPQIKLNLDYRYMETFNAKFSSAFTGKPSGVAPAPPTAFSSGHGNIGDDEILLSLRYTFGSPPVAAQEPPVTPVASAPVAPAPAPEAQRAFQVFFDFDKSDITQDATAVIQKAADEVNSGHIAAINVTGHTDTVGSAKYNQKLSERRAEAVKQQLLADGVSGSDITTLGVGKTGLLVPTPDGVREPQNRRAEIVLQ